MEATNNSQPELSSSRAKTSPGFSLTELTVVVLIMLVVSAIAFPSVLRSWNAYKLTGTAQDVAGIIKRTRFEAVRLNTNVSCIGQQVGNDFQIFVDLDGDNALDATEPQLWISGQVQVLPAGVAPGPGSMGQFYANAVLPPGRITFDPRGAVNFGANPPAVYVVYLGYPNQPTYGYRAVTVLPLSYTRVWSAAANGAWN